jgi:hypothetical protein
MKKIYDDILLSTYTINKKKDVRALSSYGKKAIPFIQELRSIETDDDIEKLYVWCYNSNRKGESIGPMYHFSFHVLTLF